jgi:hypothetical protein
VTDRPSDETSDSRPSTKGLGARRRRRRVPWWGVGVAIVACLLVANAVAAAIGPNIPRASGSEERMFIKADQIYGRAGSPDVVFLGSSDAAAGLDPDLVLDEVQALDGGYNAALAGTYLELTHEWAERVVLARLQPRVVVISVLGIPGAEDQTEVVTVNVGAQEAYRAALDQIDPGGLGTLGWELRQRAALIRYRPLLRSPSNVWQGLVATVRGDDEPATPPDAPMDFATETDPERVRELTEADGHVLDYRTPGIPGGADVAGGITLEAFGSITPDYGPLEDLVELVRDRGAVPVLTLSPIDRAAFEADGAPVENFDARTADLVRWGEANGVPVHDISGDAWPSSWFHDRFHVAEAGSEAWSRDLGTWLDERCSDGALAPAC